MDKIDEAFALPETTRAEARRIYRDCFGLMLHCPIAMRSPPSMFIELSDLFIDCWLGNSKAETVQEQQAHHDSTIAAFNSAHLVAACAGGLEFTIRDLTEDGPIRKAALEQLSNGSLDYLL